jgi:hypothetical protein
MLIAKALAVALLGLAGVAGCSPQNSARVASSRPRGKLEGFLRGYLASGKAPPDATTRVTVAGVKIKQGKPEVEIIYVTGQRWCGTGGCTMLILQPTKSSFKVIGRVTIVQLPIRLLPSTTEGNPDIAVRVSGGGVQSEYEAVLSFNGTSYPSNPSVPPARKAAGLRGRIIIASTASSVPL